MRVLGDYWPKFLTHCLKESRQESIKTTERKRFAWTAHQQQTEEASRKIKITSGNISLFITSRKATKQA